MSDHDALGFESRAIHAGSEPDPTTGAVITPIYATSTYKQDGVGGLRGGYEYSRSANPTRTALEECLAALEEGEHGLAFASGLAAEDTLLRAVCEPGDHIVVPDDAYGGSFRLFAKVEQRWGLDLTSAHVARHSGDGGGDPAGPDQGGVGRDADQPAADDRRHRGARRGRARRRGDRWWSTTPSPSPYLQQPLTLGADVVVHSTTKYCGGHSDVVGGALVVARRRAGRDAALPPERDGCGPGPFDCFLTHRGLKTLALRMERHCDNAEAVVAHLREHPAVVRGDLPRPARPPRARARRAPDAALRRDRVLPGRGRRAGRARRSATPPGCGRWGSPSAGSSR